MSDTEENEITTENITDINTTAPMLLSVKVKSEIVDESFWYMLRLTPDTDGDYKADAVIEMIDSFVVQDCWFMGEEFSKKGVKHFHLVMLCTKDPREDIKEWLLSIYSKKWKKQDGNKRYNLQEPEDLEKVFIYTSKDGDYIWGKGINSDYINYVNSKSFQKIDSRLGRLINARVKYINDELTERELFKVVCDVFIQTSASGSLNFNSAKSFLLGARILKDPKYADYLFDQI